MVERIFLISEKAVLSGDLLPPEENIYYSILADPLVKGSLEDAYALIEQAPLPLALTLNIREQLTTESIRFITSFLFIPSYLTLEYRQVINLKGNSPEMLRAATASLSSYFSLQGIREPLFQMILMGKPGKEGWEENEALHSVESLVESYRGLLRNKHDGDKSLFFYTASPEILQAALSSLQTVEKEFMQESPLLYSLIRTNKMLAKELQTLKRKYASTDAELNNQKQYIDILRSDHATKVVQDYYEREYEVLPLWYKRFGHILKVLTGKRTFRSLYRDDVKKYKD